MSLCWDQRSDSYGRGLVEVAWGRKRPVRLVCLSIEPVQQVLQNRTVCLVQA